MGSSTKRPAWNIQSQEVEGKLGFAGLEYRHDINERLDFGLHGAAVFGDVRDTSFGLSLGLTPFENGWLSVGYNIAGFEDADFAANGATGKGAFVQFRMKFDQNSVKEMFR